jgi:capsular polysaccharide biosynthesis protein
LSDEKELEDFFAQNGYEIVNPGSYSFEEQIDMFSSASHVAGITGAGFINTIFCKPGTKVIIINTSNRYNFPHWRWPIAAGMKTLCVPEIIGNDSKDFSTKDIISDMQKRGIRP